VEAGEECDDGNGFDLDCCSRFCKVEPTGASGECDDGSTPCTSSAGCSSPPQPSSLCHLNCEPQACTDVFGPHLVPAFVRRTVFVDSDANGVSQRWRTRGEFILNPGQTVDPDSEEVEVIFSRGGVTGPTPTPTPLYDVRLPPGGCAPTPSCFRQRGPDSCTKRWRFVDRQADVPTAIGWKNGKFTQRRAAVGVCGNKIQFSLRSGKNATLFTPSGTQLRQSIRIGDDCATAILACTRMPASGPARRLRCASTSP